MQATDDKAARVLRAIGTRVRPLTDADIARSARVSKASVRTRLARLIADGRVEEYWMNERGPYYRTAVR